MAGRNRVKMTIGTSVLQKIFMQLSKNDQKCLKTAIDEQQFFLKYKIVKMTRKAPKAFIYIARFFMFQTLFTYKSNDCLQIFRIF